MFSVHFVVPPHSQSLPASRRAPGLLRLSWPWDEEEEEEEEKEEKERTAAH